MSVNLVIKYENYKRFEILNRDDFITSSMLMKRITYITEYLRDNLFIGLGIPKPFLSFQDAAGAGKNMAQYDIRFSKKINRIQQAMIQELNKMAMIHLYLLGYKEATSNPVYLKNTNKYLRVTYSVKEKLLLLGHTNINHNIENEITNNQHII